MRLNISHDVQYSTWDHSWVVSAGFTSERVSSVWRAVRNDVMSAGAVGGGASAKSDWMGVVEEPERAREKVCFRDENRWEVDADMLPEGEAGRLGLGGVGGTPVRTVGGGKEEGGGFFLKERRKDHSDSNWTESNSEARGE